MSSMGDSAEHGTRSTVARGAGAMAAPGEGRR